MVKFRSNHTRSKSNASVLRLIVLSSLFVLLMYWMVKPTLQSITGSVFAAKNMSPAYYIPDGPSGEIIYRDHYSYALDSNGCIQWMAFNLRKEDISDEDLPKEDYLSNEFISPQASKNKIKDNKDCVALPRIKQYKGVLLEHVELLKGMKEYSDGNDFKLLITDFENWVSRILQKSDSLILISGSNSSVNHSSGEEEAVSLFYVILDPTPGMEKSVALNIPIRSDYKSLKDYFLPVEELERKTPWVFFAFYLEDIILEKIKSSMNVEDWY